MKVSSFIHSFTALALSFFTIYSASALSIDSEAISNLKPRLDGDEVVSGAGSSPIPTRKRKKCSFTPSVAGAALSTGGALPLVTGSPVQNPVVSSPPAKNATTLSNRLSYARSYGTKCTKKPGTAKASSSSGASARASSNPGSSPESTQEVVTTALVMSYVTTCPVTPTPTSEDSQVVETGWTVSTVYSTIISTICTKCVAPPTGSGASGPSSTAGIPEAGHQVPDGSAEIGSSGTGDGNPESPASVGSVTAESGTPGSVGDTDTGESPGAGNNVSEVPTPASSTAAPVGAAGSTQNGDMQLEAAASGQPPAAAGPAGVCGPPQTVTVTSQTTITVTQFAGAAASAGANGESPSINSDSGSPVAQTVPLSDSNALMETTNAASSPSRPRRTKCAKVKASSTANAGGPSGIEYSGSGSGSGSSSSSGSGSSGSVSSSPYGNGTSTGTANPYQSSRTALPLPFTNSTNTPGALLNPDLKPQYQARSNLDAVHRKE